MARSRRRTRAPARRTTSRRRKSKTNLISLGVSAAVANSITTGVFGANLFDFITGQQNGIYKAGLDGNARMTLPELLGIGSNVPFGGNFHSTTSIGAEINKNIQANWGKILTGVILVPAGAKALTKVLRKPVLNPMNKLIKMTGLDVKV